MVTWVAEEEQNLSLASGRSRLHQQDEDQILKKLFQLNIGVLFIFKVPYNWNLDVVPFVVNIAQPRMAFIMFVEIVVQLVAYHGSIFWIGYSGGALHTHQTNYQFIINNIK